MELKADPLFFVGAMPPPLHGMSNVNACMFQALCHGEVNIHLFDIARRGKNSIEKNSSLTTSEGEFGLFVRFVRSMASASGRKKTYLSLSGGLGQLRDLIYIAVSRIFRAKIYLHHHSFAYLNRRSFITLLCVRAAGPRSDHIVLCDRMAMLLSEQYQARPERVSCLSNAAFLPRDEKHAARPHLKTVSFLSNITFEKGISTFFELANELQARNVPVRCMIAGPVSAEVRPWLDDALEKAPHVQYFGPQYGVDKNQFFEQTDLLVFPSTYANEAEPVTILEAFSFGVPVIATALGCIPGLVSDQRGVVLEAHGCGPVAIADLIQNLEEDDSAYQRLSENCSTYLEIANSDHSSALNKIIGAIRCGNDFGGRL
ncbi:glycosyltransferase family 4 protein [Paraburkholderia sediminicola]|uniref:Glycosyltransferase family 4 protein n=1 Tax=Paraburkholderia rhynchosiae TaxID=487049 RepID=A0ACC7N519_9BURK